MPHAAKKPDSVLKDPPLRWVRRPQQERSQQTLERILDAAERLTLEKGFDAVTVADITRAARCSVGVFYSRFKDKQELLRCLADRVVGEAVATTEHALEPARWQKAPVPELLRAVLGFAVQSQRERARLIVAFTLGARSDPVLAERLLEARDRIERVVFQIVAGRKGRWTHPDPEAAVRFALSLALDVLQQRALLADVVPAARKISDKELAQELERMLLSYWGIARSANG